MQFKPAILALADGSVFWGTAIGAEGDCVGELVFNTSMTGYQEILSDPSYAKQIVTLTTAHVGNTGCNPQDMESAQIWASGLVIRNLSLLASNFRSQESLPQFLQRHHMVAIANVDTRELTLRLREQGAIGACISTKTDNPNEALAKAKAFAGLEQQDLAREVSCASTQIWSTDRGQWGKSNPIAPDLHVVVFDFGVKRAILSELQERGCHITLVPAQTSSKDVLALQPDGVVLSNGPGDPGACGYAIQATQDLLEKNIPILGICLGHQILALACGAKSLKMKFGHHGGNHPVATANGDTQVFITSQNHGFTIDETTLPAHLEVTYRSLFDHSLQGIRHKDKPALGFQGHPEASPGPHDVDSIFEHFVSLMGYMKREKNE